MEKCKDCELFEYTTAGVLAKQFSKVSPECDGLCYFRSPPWEPHPTNSEQDIDDCPHYLEFLRQDTEEYDMKMRNYLQEKGELSVEEDFHDKLVSEYLASEQEKLKENGMALLEQEAFHKLIRMFYKTRKFYNEVAERDNHTAFVANALTIQEIVNYIEQEFPWIKEENYL